MLTMTYQRFLKNAGRNTGMPKTEQSRHNKILMTMERKLKESLANMHLLTGQNGQR
jgi:hypothetical protein